MSEALARVKSFGYEIIKPLDEAKVEQMGMPDAVVEGKQGDVAEGYKDVFKQLAFVKDPDVSVPIKDERGHYTYPYPGLLGRTCSANHQITNSVV